VLTADGVEKLLLIILPKGIAAILKDQSDGIAE
jgi:hypothetical protein